MFECSYNIGRLAPWRRQALAVALLSGLTGCGHTDIIRPEVDLYHDLQGGVIAAQRPPPPGVNDPYPNLGTVPKRPAAADIAAEQRIADQLATQRDAAVAAAAASPIKVPAAPAIPKPAPPDPDANHVTVDAAPAPPAPVVAPPPVSAPEVSAIDSVPPIATAVASGPLPALAGAPPAGPAGLGPLFTPPAAAADGRPSKPAAAPAAPVVAPAASGSVVSVVFTPGSATLPPSATLNLRRFALAHKGVPITITGHGEAVLHSPEAQSGALDLALRRAAAIAVPLAAAGVSAANLRLHAEAAGQGATASL
jgi:outer membrane protein OmpA-like peptidoglycan-associated protein